jgi:hypothetical protein
MDHREFPIAAKAIGVLMVRGRDLGNEEDRLGRHEW